MIESCLDHKIHGDRCLTKRLNLYYLTFDLEDGSGDNIDWFVVAASSKEAREIWALEVQFGFDQDVEPEDASRVCLILGEVPGPARALPWRNAEPDRYCSYVEDSPQAWSKNFMDAKVATRSLYEVVSQRFELNGAGKGVVFDRVRQDIVAAVIASQDGAVRSDIRSFDDGFLARMIAAALGDEKLAAA